MSASPPSSPIDSTNSSSTIIDVTAERGEEFMMTELNNDGIAADEDDETEFEHKFALKLDLQEDVDLTQDGTVTHKTKSILETTDDQLICQIFSQTITSATVTPTDEDQIFYNNFSATIEERTDSEPENDLSPMQTQQPPSIVVDCCDENDDGGGDSGEMSGEVSGETSGSTGAKRFNETADIDLDDLDAKKISSIYFDITIEEDFVDIEVPISVVQNEDEGEGENISYDEPLEILKQKSKEEDENGNENEENAEKNNSIDNEYGDDVVADADSIEENLMEKVRAKIIINYVIQYLYGRQGNSFLYRAPMKLGFSRDKREYLCRFCAINYYLWDSEIDLEYIFYGNIDHFDFNSARKVIIVRFKTSFLLCIMCQSKGKSL